VIVLNALGQQKPTALFDTTQSGDLKRARRAYQTEKDGKNTLDEIKIPRTGNKKII
jgi:hypothetical protein